MQKETPKGPEAADTSSDKIDEIDELDELVDRVFESASAEPGIDELSRLLELAIRDRSVVRVTAAARGQEQTFMLLPVALTSGRLRASDETAGVQRTIPLSAIVSVEAA